MLKLIRANEKTLEDCYVRINGNQKRFKDIIETWDNKYKILSNGKEILITKSGILISCHLSGIRNVILFLYYDNDDPKDCMGTRISVYMGRFSGYKI